MALYALADTHLCGGVEKPMDIFGARWNGHTEKIRRRWSTLVTDSDTVVIAGDFSWAMTLDEAAEDFRFIDSLPGRKLISKGNHDYWWTTVSKMKRYLSDIGVTSVDFLHNNAFIVDGIAVAGARGWFIEPKMQPDLFDADYPKLVHRECERIRTSVTAAEKLKNGADIPTAVFLHFPPVFGDFVCRPIVDELKSSGVSHVYYGHIHSNYLVPHTVNFEGIGFSIVSSDYLDFTPSRVFA